MTTSKNPMRQLATSIVLACKRDGLKQSVVLNTLTKQAGFRSIQASDSVQPSTPDADSKTSIPAHAKMYLKGLACDVFYDSMSYDFVSEGEKPATRESTGDSLSFFILEQIDSDPVHLINSLHDYAAKAEDFAENISNNVFEKTAESVTEFIATYELPEKLAAAFVNEIMDGTDPTDDIKQWISDAWRLTFEQVHQLEALNRAFQSSMIVDQLIS